MTLCTPALGQAEGPFERTVLRPRKAYHAAAPCDVCCPAACVPSFLCYTVMYCSVVFCFVLYCIAQSKPLLAGKTYTMSGPQNFALRGMLPRAVSHVFNEIAGRPDQSVLHPPLPPHPLRLPIPLALPLNSPAAALAPESSVFLAHPRAALKAYDSEQHAARACVPSRPRVLPAGKAVQCRGADAYVPPRPCADVAQVPSRCGAGPEQVWRR